MKILLVADEASGANALKLVAKAGHSIPFVLTSFPTGDNAASTYLEAQRLGLTCKPAEQIKNPSLADEIRQSGVELLLNVHSLYIIPDEILSAPSLGCFNLHPGPLPEYAGLDAPSWALYNGEAEHGVSLHWMAPGIDTGPLAYEARFPITERDTGLGLSLKCVKSGLPLISRLLEQAADDPQGIPKLEQDLAKRRYYRRKAPQEGRLDWNRSARQIVDHVRACDYSPFASPWGFPEAGCGKTTFRVTKAAVEGGDCNSPPGLVGTLDEKGARVATGDGWLRLIKLQQDGRNLHPQELLSVGTQL